jgi:phosphopantetheinyl transferase (holo-ACP synthase)
VFLKEKFKTRKKYIFVRYIENKIDRFLNKKLKQKRFKSVKRDSFLRSIENIDYKYFFLFYFIGIVIFACIFQYLSTINESIVPTYTIAEDTTDPISFFDFLYFSVVTIASLGYGDYRPIGLGRYIVIFEILYGLVIFALFISKLASDRTSSLTKLIYTSDVERRVQQIIIDYNDSIAKLKVAKHTNDYDEISKRINYLANDYAIKYAFFKHQSAIGDIDGRWAEKLFLKLIKTIHETVDSIIPIAKVHYIKNKTINDYDNVLKKALKLSASIEKHYDYEKISSIHQEVESSIKKFYTFIEEINTKACTSLSLQDIKEEVIMIVKSKLPETTPWEKDIHKKIAEELGLSNKFVGDAIFNTT